MRPSLPVALALAVSFAAAAAAAPPADGMRLSDIVRAVEQRPDFRYFDEIEWDDDGYWEVEYVTRDGRKIELKIDPRTGQPRR